MRILCIYFQSERRLRSTVREHLSAFRQYSGADCYYLNVAHGVPSYIKKLYFDLIIYHYTFLALKWDIEEFEKVQMRISALKYVGGYKIAIPQDEYIYSRATDKFFREFGIKTVFTCLPLSEWRKVYDPEGSGVQQYFTVLTGYVDAEAVRKFANKVLPLSARTTDVGYRGRKVPYWLGEQGQIKLQLGERFKEILARTNSLRYDISCDRRDEITGDAWYEFLSRCRVVLGCEGGASLHDATGGIRMRVEHFLDGCPSASFEEVRAKCFPGVDGNLDLCVLSPRHFECCVTRSCQALVEGRYGGVLKPDVHFIEIKKDWSNLQDVVRKIENISYCQKIADRAYKDVVEPGLYSYDKFVDHVLEAVEGEITKRKVWGENSKIDLGRLRMRELLNPILLYYVSPYYKVKGGLKRMRKYRVKRAGGECP